MVTSCNTIIGEGEPTDNSVRVRPDCHLDTEAVARLLQHDRVLSGLLPIARRAGSRVPSIADWARLTCRQVSWRGAPSGVQDSLASAPVSGSTILLQI